MKTKRILSCFILLGLGISPICMPAQDVSADTGPKPTMKFEFVYEISPSPKIVSGIQYECNAADCSDPVPIREVGPQRLSCGETGCSSLAYNYSEYHLLSIMFSDGKKRESNVFTKKHYQAIYTVNVREDSLLVTETRGSSKAGLVIFDIFFLLIQQYLNLGLLVTLITELAIGLIYVTWRKRPWFSVLLTILLMNMVTQPVLWFLVKELRLSLCIWVYVLEVIVWLVEARILYIVLRKSARFSETLLLSLAMNLASFGIGLLLPL